MGTIKDINGIDLTEAEDIKKRWQEYTEKLYKKDLQDPDNHIGVITHLEPDILETRFSRNTTLFLPIARMSNTSWISLFTLTRLHLQPTASLLTSHLQRSTLAVVSNAVTTLQTARLNRRHTILLLHLQQMVI